MTQMIQWNPLAQLESMRRGWSNLIESRTHDLNGLPDWVPAVDIAEEDKDRISADYGLSSLQFNRVLHRARQRYKELLTERLGGGEQAFQVAGAILLLLITLWRGARHGGGL